MTPEPSLSDRFSSFYVRYEYIVVLFFILIWQAVLLLTSDGRLMETDSYTHALRLSDFIQSGSWRETLYRHDNCPYGQILHFTRLADMFLYVTTMPFLPFTELKKAVLYGCFLYNPVIACLSAVTLIWAGKAFFSPPLCRFLYRRQGGTGPVGRHLDGRTLSPGRPHPQGGLEVELQADRRRRGILLFRRKRVRLSGCAGGEDRQI